MLPKANCTQGIGCLNKVFKPINESRSIKLQLGFVLQQKIANSNTYNIGDLTAK